MAELSLAFGCTLEELDDRMSDDEMAFWRARWELLPWGEVARWWRHAERQATSVNLVPKKKGTPAAKVSDYFVPHNID